MNPVEEPIWDRDDTSEGTRLFNSIQEHSPAVTFVWRMTEGWPVEYVSGNVSQFGYSPEAFLSGDIRYDNIIDPDDLSRVSEEVARHMAAGDRKFRQSYRILTADGATRWVDDYTQIIPDRAGNPAFNQGIIIDVTDRVMADERARALATLPRENPSPLLRVDVNGDVILANDAAQAVVARLADDNDMTVTPEQRKAWREMLGKACRLTAKEHMELSVGEFLYTFLIVPVPTQQHTNLYGTDVTEMRRQQDTLHDIASNVPGIFFQYVAHPDGSIAMQHVSGNVESIWGFSAERIEADPLLAWSLVHPDDVAALRASVETSARDLTAWLHVWRSCHPSGSILWLRGAGQPRRLGDGGTLWNALILDVTKEQEAQARTNNLAELRRVTMACQKAIIGSKTERELLDSVAVALGDGRGYAHVQFLRPSIAGGEADTIVGCHRHGDNPQQRLCSAGLRTDPARTFDIPVAPDVETNLILQVGGDVDRFDEDESNMLAEVADNIGLALRVLRLQDQRLDALASAKNAALDTVEAVASMVEARDPYTAGHQAKVARLSVAAAQHLGWSQERIEGLRLGATIHDIGKVSLPMEILNRPGRLRDAEMELIREHPATGAQILKNARFQWPIQEMISQHHERMDGSGYPLGLKGDEIIPEARLIAVADVLEAMTSHRPYRPSLGIEAARQLVLAERGTKLDPIMVDACLAAIDRDTEGKLLGL